MKKILFAILIITLPLIAFFQYKSYKRFNPPTAYEYQKSDNIDINYHDYALVEEYFSKIVEVSAYARNKWRNEEIDVRFPGASEKEQNIANQYNLLLSRIGNIEARLEQSAKWKAEGYSNEEIKLIESGVSIQAIKWMDQKELVAGSAIGDAGEPIWIIQSLLIEKGYDHPLDGVFGVATQNAVLSFQRDQSLFPTGIIDQSTVKALFSQ